MLRNTTNPEATIVTMAVSAGDMLNHVVVQGKAARTAALQLCYSATAFILLVNHFTDAKAKGYMTRTNAVEYLSKQIKEQAGVEGKMLDIYLRNASSLAGMLTGSVKMFAPQLQSIAKATKPEAVVEVLSDWMNKNHADRGLRRKIDSLSALSEALGYSTGRPTPGAGSTLTSANAATRVTNTMKAVEKITGHGAGKVPERQIAQAVVVQAKSPGIFAKEAIKRITDKEELTELVKFIGEHIKTLAGLAEKAAASVKEAKAPAKNAKPAKKGKAQVSATTA